MFRLCSFLVRILNCLVAHEVDSPKEQREGQASRQAGSQARKQASKQANSQSVSQSGRRSGKEEGSARQKRVAFLIPSEQNETNPLGQQQRWILARCSSIVKISESTRVLTAKPSIVHQRAFAMKVVRRPTDNRLRRCANVR